MHKYRIVDAPDIEQLEQLIELMMDKDWRPLGGISVDNGRLYQAMWKQV